MARIPREDCMAGTRPSIITLADDMGFSDTGPFDSEIHRTSSGIIADQVSTQAVAIVALRIVRLSAVPPPSSRVLWSVGASRRCSNRGLCRDVRQGEETLVGDLAVWAPARNAVCCSEWGASCEEYASIHRAVCAVGCDSPRGGRGSTDPDHGDLTYLWTVVAKPDLSALVDQDMVCRHRWGR